MRPKFMSEPPRDQPHGTLLDEYVRCSMDLYEGQVSPPDLEMIGEYVAALRDEIVRRMREEY